MHRTIKRCRGHLSHCYGFRVVRVRPMGLSSDPTGTRVRGYLFGRTSLVVGGVPGGARVVALYIRNGRLSDVTFTRGVSRGYSDNENVAFVVNDSCNLDREMGNLSSAQLSLSGVAFPRRLFEIVLYRRVCHTFGVSRNSACRGWCVW